MGYIVNPCRETNQENQSKKQPPNMLLTMSGGSIACENFEY